MEPVNSCGQAAMAAMRISSAIQFDSSVARVAFIEFACILIVLVVFAMTVLWAHVSRSHTHIVLLLVLGFKAFANFAST